MQAEAPLIVRKVKDIEYRLLPGTARQTTDIVIERDGGITVRPPARMTPEHVDETVLSRRHWIYGNLAEWRDLNATRVVREWVSGESFLYLGSAYRLLLVADQDEPLKLQDGRFCLSEAAGRPPRPHSGITTSPEAKPASPSKWLTLRLVLGSYRARFRSRTSATAGPAVWQVVACTSTGNA